MNRDDCVIRLEKIEEQKIVEELVRDSFWNIYRPGAYEHYVLHILRDNPDFVPELNFVMEINGKIIGQSVCMKSHINADDGQEIPTLMLGPICISNELKRKGYGKKLLDFVFEKAAELGYGAMLFEGNIDFYGKSGCREASQYSIRYHGLPEGEDASFFLCRELKKGYLDGITGEYAPVEAYYVSQEDVDAFDKTFPPKEKQKLPGQIFE